MNKNVNNMSNISEIKSFLNQLMVQKEFNLRVLNHLKNNFDNLDNSNNKDIEETLTMKEKKVIIDNFKNTNSIENNITNNPNYKNITSTNTNNITSSNKFKSKNKGIKNKTNLQVYEKIKRSKSSFQKNRLNNDLINICIDKDKNNKKGNSNKELFIISINVRFDESYICVSDLVKKLDSENDKEINELNQKNMSCLKQVSDENYEILSTLRKELNDLEMKKTRDLKSKSHQLSNLIRKLNLKRQLLINKVRLKELNIPLNENYHMDLGYYNSENDNLNNSFDLYNK